MCLSCAHHVSCVILLRSCVCSDSLRPLHFPLSAYHLLSYHPVLLPAHQLHLPRCGGQIPCALSLMRTLAPCRVRPSHRICLLLLRQVPASKSLGMSIASDKPDSRMNMEPSSLDAASTSQVRLKDAYLGGLKEKQRRDPSHREEEDSEDSDNPAADVDRYTSHVTFSPAERTCFMMCDAPHWLKCLHEHVMSSPWSSMSCV